MCSLLKQQDRKHSHSLSTRIYMQTKASMCFKIYTCFPAIMILFMKTSDSECDDHCGVSIFYLWFEWSWITMTHKRFGYTSLSHHMPTCPFKVNRKYLKVSDCFKVSRISRWLFTSTGQTEITFIYACFYDYMHKADPFWLKSVLQILYRKLCAQTHHLSISFPLLIDKHTKPMNEGKNNLEKVRSVKGAL